MDYLTFSQKDFSTNEKMANTAIDLLNKQLGLPKPGTTTCSDLIKHPNGIQTAISLIDNVSDLAQKLDLASLGAEYVKVSLPDDWYQDVDTKEFIETKFDTKKVDPDIKPNEK